MSEAPKLKVEMWEIDKIVPYAKNAKQHPPSQVNALAKSLREHGFSQPIVVDADGVIIAGHGRRLASIANGWARVPVICRRDLSKEQAMALRLADNKLASDLYDTELLQSELSALNELGFDMDLTGFSGKELDFLTTDLGSFDDDAFVEDISTAVEKQKEENAEKAAEIDASDVPVAKAFGFTKISVAESRRIRSFMTRIETETSRKGIDALMHFLTEFGVE